MKKRKQEERREVWAHRVTEQESSGQSIRAFCRGQQLNEHSFYMWRQRIRSAGEPIRFALVEAQQPAAQQGARPEAIELVLSSGDRLRIPSDAATLRLVLNVLREQQHQNA